ncbi:MAG TPA: diacylglycerol kinase family protein [Micromonosporaceae bacterium]
MHVVLLSLASPGGCSGERVPVLTCRDALRSTGAEVSTMTAEADEQIDAVLSDLGQDRRLVVAAATDGELRAVLRRLVRRHAPAPSKRPADLPADRTVPDLPPIGVLPMDAGTPPELVARLDLPRTPGDVASAVTGGLVRRVDLLRTDSGSVTLHGALVGGADQHGQATVWYGRVEVDDAVLTDGSEPLIACAVANAPGYATIDSLPLVGVADPADGSIDVGIAVPVLRRGLLRRTIRVEVRRSRGRAVSITPRDDVPYLDDGVAGSLGRKRSWWIERSAWAVYVH